MNIKNIGLLRNKQRIAMEFFFSKTKASSEGKGEKKGGLDCD